MNQPPQSLTNLFNNQNLTNEELQQARVFTELQLRYLTQFKVEAAMELLNLQYDLDNPAKLPLASAYVQGQIAILDMLIQDHFAALEAKQAQQTQDQEGE